MLSKSEVNYIQSLAHQKGRKVAACFVAEGVKIVNDFFQFCPNQFEMIFATEEYAEQFPLVLKRVSHKIIGESMLKRISQLQSPNQVVAILRQFEHPNPYFDNNSWMIALDGIQDPGNLGTIIRNADWFGVKAICCSEDTVDCYNPKVVQASMGSIARVAVHYLNLEQFISKEKCKGVGACMVGIPLQDFNWQGGGVLVIGREGVGIRKNIHKLLKYNVLIPTYGGGESLNAAVASGIFLWQIRQSLDLNKSDVEKK